MLERSSSEGSALLVLAAILISVFAIIGSVASPQLFESLAPENGTELVAIRDTIGVWNPDANYGHEILIPEGTRVFVSYGEDSYKEGKSYSGVLPFGVGYVRVSVDGTTHRWVRLSDFREP